MTTCGKLIFKSSSGIGGIEGDGSYTRYIDNFFNLRISLVLVGISAFPMNLRAHIFHGTYSLVQFIPLA